MTAAHDPLPARALERLVRDAIRAGRKVVVRSDGEVVFNGEEALSAADRLDLMDLKK